nr:type II secretion system F family protein [Pseudomonas aegrilactucae]
MLLGLFCLALLGVSIRLFYSGLRKSGNERIMQRLGQHQVPVAHSSPSRLGGLERVLLRAGFDWRTERLVMWLALWLLLAGVAGLFGGWPGALLAVVLGPVLLRLYLSWCYQRRVQQIIAQLPTLLDQCVRSLKAGRTLNDAVIGAIDAAREPLLGTLQRVKRNVHMGVSLDDAMSDLAQLYERDELRMFALGLRINHRYGGNASELLENLIKVIREREQGARQLRAMTGETRITAVVLAVLPVSVAGYFLLSNPHYLLTMWHDAVGQRLLFSAFVLQGLGCVVLWRMLRSI